MKNKALVNKVAQKAIISIDMISFLPKATEIVAFDIKDFLYKELLLKEKEFRIALKNYDWALLKNKYVYMFCSNNAIIPMWAYMLLSSYINPVAKQVVYADNTTHAEELFLLNTIENIDIKEYNQKRIVVKGCGEKKFSPLVYTRLVHQLQPVAKAISFGEACSMVPVFKK